jgi:hypothetical protein
MLEFRILQKTRMLSPTAAPSTGPRVDSTWTTVSVPGCLPLIFSPLPFCQFFYTREGGPPVIRIPKFTSSSLIPLKLAV